MTGRRRGGKIEEILEEITRLMNGWLGYYRITDIKAHLKRISEWLRRRIRQILWKRWKKAQTRYENLMRLGTPREMARQWVNTGKGYWRIAGSIVLTSTLQNRYIEELGLLNILKRYEELRERAKQPEIVHGTC
jgi:hypothetical protein